MLHFEHTGPGFTREAKCTGCPWSAPAPGTGYARGRQLHTEAHAELLASLARPVVDLYAGPGGWDCAARWLGLDPIGIELDADTCATRAAAGLRTIRARIGPDGYRLPPGTRLAGLIASPPCQAFSAAGTREGATQLTDYINALEANSWATPAGEWHPDLHLLAETVRWAVDHEPTWIAFEQVRAVLPFWQATVRRLRALGWWCWTGLLDAVDYGAPQCRTRAVLMAHRDRAVAPPIPTHSEHPDLFGSAPWVTMADALGMAGGIEVDTRQMSTVGGGGRRPYVRSADRPATTVTGQSLSQWVLNRREHTDWTLPMPVDQPSPTVTNSTARNWCWERPATTITGDRAGTEAVRLTIAQAATLQTFPDGWPWQGNKTSQARQVGNAVPPLLARDILAELVA